MRKLRVSFYIMGWNGSAVPIVTADVLLLSLVLRHGDALFNRVIKLFRNLFHYYWSIFGTSVLVPFVFRALPAIGTCARLVPTYRVELRERSTVFPFSSFAIERKRNEKRQMIPR